MSNSEARQRRGSRARGDDEVEEDESAVDTRPIFDIPEGQLLIVACGTLVFISVIAIFLVLIFSLTGSAAAPIEELPVLPTCFGFTDLPESSQLATTCSTTIRGFCSGPGTCNTFVVVADAVTNTLPTVQASSCAFEACENIDEDCTCSGFGGNVAAQACVRNQGTVSERNFQCRLERECPVLDADPEGEPTADCQLGVELPGRCFDFDPAAGCQYDVFAADGVAELRNCAIGPANECVDGACKCFDAVCVRDEKVTVCP